MTTNTIPIVNGVDPQKVQKISHSACDDCQLGKSCRQARPMATKESRKSTGPLDLVHADIVGPVKHPSFAGKKYFIPLYDENTAISLVRFLPSRDEAGREIQEMITDLVAIRKGRVKQFIITSYGADRVKRLRADNANELLSQKYKN